MNRITTLIEYFRKNPKPSEETVPEGFCPNCWGKQEYGGKFYEVAKNYKVDINSTDPKSGWIQDYADKHLSGIQLNKKNDLLVCQNCKLTYFPSKE